MARAGRRRPTPSPRRRPLRRPRAAVQRSSPTSRSAPASATGSVEVSTAGRRSSSSRNVAGGETTTRTTSSSTTATSSSARRTTRVALRAGRRGRPRDWLWAGQRSRRLLHRGRRGGRRRARHPRDRSGRRGAGQAGATRRGARLVNDVLSLKRGTSRCRRRMPRVRFRGRPRSAGRARSPLDPGSRRSGTRRTGRSPLRSRG